MAADKPPSAEGSLLGPPLLFATRLALRFPVATITFALGLAGLALLFTYTRLEYKTSRLDLLDPESDYNRLWVEYIEEFGNEDDAVVVVEGPSRDDVVPVIEELARELKTRDRLFHAVLHDVDLTRVQAKGLHYLPLEELHGIEQFVDYVAPVVDDGWSRLNLGSLAQEFSARLDSANQPDPRQWQATVDEVDRLATSLLSALEGTDGYQSPWPAMPASFATLSELNSGYLLAKEGQLGFVLLRLAEGEDGFARASKATDALRELISRVRERHPRVAIGLTGLPIMENDEMRSSQTSMYWASLLSLAGVALLFVAGFGGVRHALLANLVLLVGIAWSFGYVTVAIGHLNILSMSFTVTLIGIGIDYGVYYISRYLEVRQHERSCIDALLKTTAGVGPAILTGAITTAIAFFAAGLASFPGVAELGQIAGGGILLCAAAELLVLPAVLAVVDQAASVRRIPEPLPVERWINPWLRAPRLLLLGTTIATGALALGVDNLWYDHNLLNLQAEGLESVELEHKLLAETNRSSWYALSIAESEAELRARAEKFKRLASVERTEDIVQFFPSDQQAKQPSIVGIREKLASLPERPPLIPVDEPERLGRALRETRDRLAPSAEAAHAVQQLDRVRNALRRLTPSVCNARVRGFQQNMAGDLLSRLLALHDIANPAAISMADLPAAMVDRFVGRHGKHLLKIYGKGNIWDMDALTRFVNDVRSVDPRATGNPLQAYEASLEMKSSYQQSALYALAVIMVVLFLDLRSVGLALLALVPLGVGVLQMFGLMGLLNIPLNPANTIALPLILGIGVDYGVHIIHEYREQTGPYRLSHATAVAVLVDALTTIVGFGSLMIASHQGLQSLGRVLTLGVSCCLFTSMVMLPAALAWITRGRASQPNGEERQGEAAEHAHAPRTRVDAGVGDPSEAHGMHASFEKPPAHRDRG